MRILRFLTRLYLHKPVAFLALVVGATGTLIAIFTPLAVYPPVGHLALVNSLTFGALASALLLTSNSLWPAIVAVLPLAGLCAFFQLQQELGHRLMVKEPLVLLAALWVAGAFISMFY